MQQEMTFNDVAIVSFKGKKTKSYGDAINTNFQGKKITKIKYTIHMYVSIIIRFFY